MGESPRAITNRLAIYIYLADMELQGRPAVLWDMLPPKKQIVYVNAANRVLKNVGTKTTPIPRREKIDSPRRA